MSLHFLLLRGFTNQPYLVPIHLKDANFLIKLASGCGSVGRAVASDTGLRFESSPWQTFISDIYLFTVVCIEKTKIKKKRP